MSTGDTPTGGTAVGVFHSRELADDAVRSLRAAGFPDDRIGMIARPPVGPPADASGLAADPTGTRWEEGTGVGAAAGAATGLGLGLAVAAGLIPPLGPVIAGGTLMALVASAGAGATVGTVLGGLVGLGIPEADVERYAAEFQAGRAIVVVQAGDRTADAKAILGRHGAVEPA